MIISALMSLLRLDIEAMNAVTSENGQPSRARQQQHIPYRDELQVLVEIGQHVREESAQTQLCHVQRFQHLHFGHASLVQDWQVLHENKT
jgi:hypothetical protein